MLHSTLPRAFLAPGLSYLGYYGDEVHHPYPSSATWHIPVDDHSVAYTRMSEHHVLQSSQWEISRASTPCPLDLSLKPPPTPSTPRTEDAIEVDDEEDRRIHEETQRQLENRRYRRDSEDDPLIVDDDIETPRSSSVQSHHSHITHPNHVSYERLHPRKESPQLQEMLEKTRLPEDTTHLSPYSSSDLTQKYHHLHSQKMLLSSPTQLQSMQTYHQQLLLTPQHHLQGIHAPMTPPSTPSPPQCPRRRTRDEDMTSPSGTSINVTPRQTPNSSSSEKPTSRPKKKHARRLKFDEDTSSPVSGTVILGPDEAVVTGDIDPAFNIVEVTEEARAELAKIENRLGPYQCKLCRQLHDDAFQLAQHRCSRIAHVEYRCPECDKRFSCPANLASHRRWHKPRLPNGETANSTSTNNEIPCTRCDAKFTRQAALRKHLASQHPETNNNTNNNNNVSIDGQETMGKIEAMQIGATNSLTSEIP